MVALRKPKPLSVDELEGQLACLSGDVAQTTVSLDDLKGRRRELLLTATDDEILAHDDAVKAAARQIERLNARADALRELLAERRADEARAAVAARRAEIKLQCERAREVLKQYPGLCEKINAIVRQVNEAKGEAVAFNHSYPDEEPIVDPEIEARGQAQEPDIIESESEVWFWREVSSGQRVFSKDAHVTYDGFKLAPKDRELLEAIRTGHFVPEPDGRFLNDYGGEVVPSRYLKRTVLTAPLQAPVAPLSESVNLPPLRPELAKAERTREVIYLLVDEPTKEQE